jgi:Holliday junction resolvase
MKVNKTSLSHKTTQEKLKIFIRKALVTKQCQHIANKKGKAYIAVRYLTGDTAWQVLGKSSGFWFLDSTGRDITKLVLQSLRVPN